MANISKVIFNSGAFMVMAEELRQYFFCARIPFSKANTEDSAAIHIFNGKRDSIS